MSRADEFMDIYRQLEAIATDKYNLPKDGKAVRFWKSSLNSGI